MAQLPDLEAWAIFARVAALRSFTAAAGELHLSKATVSKAVTRLEARIGTRLFHRSSRRLSLTLAGEGLAARAGALLADAQAAEEEARAAAIVPVGLVRIAAPMSFGLAYLARALPDLIAQHPGLRIDLSLDDRRVDLVAEGFDLALRIAALADSALVARRLCDVPFAVVAAPAYLAAAGAPRHPAELSHHACMTYANLPTQRMLFRGPEGEETWAELAGPLRINNADAMLPALEAGLGIAVAPRFVFAEALAAGRLIEILAGWAPPPVGLHLVMPPGGHRPARVRAVIDHLVKSLSIKSLSGSLK